MGSATLSDTNGEPVKDSIDIISPLLCACPPEIIPYVFSFTTHEHATAAGFFDVAIKLPPILETPQDDDFQPPTILQHAVQKGDLPLLRHLLLPRHLSKDGWEFLASSSCPYEISSDNLHVYMYLSALIDTSSPLLSGTNAPEQQQGIFTKIRRWAMLSIRIDILEWLYASRFVQQTQPGFLDWDTLLNQKQLQLIEHVYNHSRFNELTDTPDRILRIGIQNNWPEALTYLHNRGVRFLSWDEADLACIDRKYIASGAREFDDDAITFRTMHVLNMLPEDTCPECRDRWLPRIGWWGMFAVYQSHADTEKSIHGVEPDGDDAAAAIAMDALENIWPHHGLRSIVSEAVRDHDVGVLEYIGRLFPQAMPAQAILIQAILTNDVEIVRSCAERFPAFVEEIGAKSIVLEFTNYYDAQTRTGVEKIASIVEIARLLDTALHNRKKPRLAFPKLFIERAARARDAALLWWSMGTRDGTLWHIQKRYVEMWREGAVEGGAELAELTVILDARLRDMTLGKGGSFGKLRNDFKDKARADGAENVKEAGNEVEKIVEVGNAVGEGEVSVETVVEGGNTVNTVAVVGDAFDEGEASVQETTTEGDNAVGEGGVGTETIVEVMNRVDEGGDKVAEVEIGDAVVVSGEVIVSGEVVMGGEVVAGGQVVVGGEVVIGGEVVVGGQVFVGGEVVKVEDRVEKVIEFGVREVDIEAALDFWTLQDGEEQ